MHSCFLRRNGWYCLESDVARSPELAGYRGLLDPEVRIYFNNTFWSYGEPGEDCYSGWGPNGELMKNLGIDFELNCMGPAAETIIAERLAAGVSSVFYLWEPHPLHKRYVLNRIQLPTYAQAKFDQGLSDYPTDILTKTASAMLPKLAPKVWQMLQRFMIDRYELLAPVLRRSVRLVSADQQDPGSASQCTCFLAAMHKRVCWR